MDMTVGVLALQGAFREHAERMRALGLRAVEVRRPAQLDEVSGMILPGGESTVMGKLLLEWEIMEPLRRKILAGMPVYGTCAGLILLCAGIESHPEQPRLGLLDATVRRNAFGRQVDSFSTGLPLPELGAEPFPAVFIRAPVLTRTGPDVQVLATVEGRPVAVRQDWILGTSFHPELTTDIRLHQYFADMMAKAAGMRP